MTWLTEAMGYAHRVSTRTPIPDPTNTRSLEFFSVAVYQKNPDMLPDSEFEPAQLHHLVAGNVARFLDTRRTPVTVVEVREQFGEFEVRLDDFEDEGTHWILPLQSLRTLQFRKGSKTLAQAGVDGLRAAIQKFDRPLVIECDPANRDRSEKRIQIKRLEVGSWLEEHSNFFSTPAELPNPSSRAGIPALYHDLKRYFESCGQLEREKAFATQYVSNPFSGELITGYRIMLAEMGLAPYEDLEIRNPAAFEREGGRDHHEDYLVTRMAFVREVFSRCGREHVLLYRGYFLNWDRMDRKRPSFVSSSFSRDVSASHTDSGPDPSIPMLLAQATPINRLFMTHVETEEMNLHYKEAEAILLYDADSPVF